VGGDGDEESKGEDVRTEAAGHTGWIRAFLLLLSHCKEHRMPFSSQENGPDYFGFALYLQEKCSILLTMRREQTMRVGEVRGRGLWPGGRAR
jgi:hypothetical protein